MFNRSKSKSCSKDLVEKTSSKGQGRGSGSGSGSVIDGDRIINTNTASPFITRHENENAMNISRLISSLDTHRAPESYLRTSSSSDTEDGENKVRNEYYEYDQSVPSTPSNHHNHNDARSPVGHAQYEYLIDTKSQNNPLNSHSYDRQASLRSSSPAAREVDQSRFINGNGDGDYYCSELICPMDLECTTTGTSASGKSRQKTISPCPCPCNQSNTTSPSPLPSSFRARDPSCYSPLFCRISDPERDTSPNGMTHQQRQLGVDVRSTEENGKTPDTQPKRFSTSKRTSFRGLPCSSDLEQEGSDNPCEQLWDEEKNALIPPRIGIGTAGFGVKKEKRTERGRKPSKEPSNSKSTLHSTTTSVDINPDISPTLQHHHSLSRQLAYDENRMDPHQHNDNTDKPMEEEFHSVPPPPPPRPPSESYPTPLFIRTPVDFHGPNPHTNNAAGPSAYPHHLASSYLSHPQHHLLPMVYTANPPQHPSISPTNTYHHIYRHTLPDNKRRRGRLATACINCNRRKQRCDGEVPCGLCVKRNVSCSYPTEMNTSYNADAEKTRQAGIMASSSASPTRQPSKKARISAGGDVARLNDTSYKGKGKAREGKGEDVIMAERMGRGSSLPSQTIGHRQQPGGAPSNLFREPTSAQSSNLPLPIASHPVSSERSNPMLPRLDQPQQDPESSLGRFWRSYSDIRPSTSPLPSSTGVGAGTRGGGGSNEKDETCSSSASEKLMEENEAYGVGSLRTHTGPWDEGKGEKTFFGTSHFGPQLAAKVIRGMPTVPLADVRHAPYRGTSRLDGVKPYTLESQTRELVSYLPEREECDQYVRRFFDRYNSHNDILYQPDFMVAYHRFWNDYNIKQSSQVDLRYLGLLLIVLALGVLLDHDPSEKVKRQTQLGDLKLSEDQKVIIEGMMEQLESQTMSLKDREEKSSKWSWAAKRALLESSSFFGESMDTVRAGLLIALYLNVCRRVPEAWTAIGTAIRAAQAQGLHVDGSSWKGMSTKDAELRRRLWAQLYAVDRSIALFLGRPVCIQDGEFTTREPANMHDDELEMPATFPRGLNIPTKNTFLILHYRLNKIIGKVQLTCFNLNPRKYSDIQECEEMFLNFKDSLPPHFRLDRAGTDFSLDDQQGYSWLPIQRQTLNAKFHLARISLHRPYLLRSLGKGKGKKLNPYLRSRDALLNSATADLRLRFTFNELDPLDRFKWMTVASGFNSATILGILCHLGYKDVQFPKGSLRSMIQAYIALEEKTIRRDEALETELMVLKMMEARALAREEMESRSGRTTPGSYGSGGATDPKLLIQIQINQSRFAPPQQDHPRSTSSGNGPYPNVGEGHAGGMSTGMGMDVNVSNEIWQTSSGSGGLAHGNHEEVNQNSSMKLSNRLEDEEPFERDFNVNLNYEATNIPLPTPIPHSLSTPSLSTALGLPNYNIYNPNPNSNQQDEGRNQQNEWYLPSDWDPTTSGLPDSSDPSAWQALLGMDWMNNLDLDMGFDMREVGMVGDEDGENQNGVVGITQAGGAGAGGAHNGWREN